MNRKDLHAPVIAALITALLAALGAVAFTIGAFVAKDVFMGVFAVICVVAAFGFIRCAREVASLLESTTSSR